MGTLIVPLLFIAAILYVAYPLLRENSPDEIDETRLSEYEGLLLAKDEIVTGLKDIEMDFRMGKLSNEDYLKLKGEFEARAVGVFEALDRFEGTSGEPASH